MIFINTIRECGFTPLRAITVCSECLSKQTVDQLQFIASLSPLSHLVILRVTLMVTHLVTHLVTLMVTHLVTHLVTQLRDLN